MKIIFMGTPEFAVSTLEGLIKGGHEVVLVVTQPDKPKGRGGQMQLTPVKEAAISHNIPVYQPMRIREAESVELLRNYNPDAIVVTAFGQILSKEILEVPKYGCINVHASLLPKYRGAAPIQWAIIDGEKETGITTMLMDVGLDTGDMLDKAIVSIDKRETGGSLHDKLAKLGGDLILKTLEKLENGTAIREKQDDALSCYAKMLSKELGNINFEQSAVEIERLVRGLNPWPSAYTKLNGKTLKIWETVSQEAIFDGKAGEIVSVTKDEIIVMTGNGQLVIKELQLEGKKRMKTQDFLRGYPLQKGECLPC